MKHIGNLLLIVLILSLTMATGGCGAKFELSSIEVSPEVCLAGETVTVSATLNHSGSAQSEYTAELLLDDTVERTQTLTVEPESSQSLSFTLAKNTPGEYVVQLGELTASFIVLEASNFNLSPSEVEIDQPVTVSANLRNAADTQANINCCLLCQGTEAANKDVTLAGNSESEVTFTLSRSIPGTYVVKLGNLSGFFRVLKPAEIEVVSLDISPNPVKVGGMTAITMDIKNVGEVAGTYTASLVVDGEICDTQDVTLAGDDTETLLFSISKDSPGSYSIEIGGQEATLEVVQPVRLPTGIIYVDELFDGTHAFKTHNETSSDMVVILSSTEEPTVPLVTLYVQSGDSYSFSEVAAGTYILYFTFGEDWDNNSKKFLSGFIYGRFSDEFLFEQWSGVSRIWEFTFGTTIADTLTTCTVDEDEFPCLE